MNETIITESPLELWSLESVSPSNYSIVVGSVVHNWGRLPGAKMMDH